MKRFLLAAVILPFAVLSGCNSVSDPPADENLSELVPLAVGNRWIYRTTTYDSLGAVAGTKQDTDSIVSFMTIEDHRWFVWKEDDGSSEVHASVNLKDGFWNYLSTESFADAKRLTRYPLAVGNVDTLDKLITIDNGDIVLAALTAHLSALDRSITVPAGKFACREIIEGFRLPDHSYANNEMDTVVVAWYASHVGRVRSDNYYRLFGGGSYLGSRQELISYQVNK